MSLAGVLHPPPGKSGFNEWLFHHWQDHLAIVQKIADQYNIILPTYNIDPLIAQDLKGWGLRHQNFHNDMNGVLGTDGSDLETINWSSHEERESWFFLNFRNT